MERKLQRLNWLQVRDFVPEKIDTILLPVGTVEAHGSACMGTDNFIPETIAEGIAERLNALIAATVNYGITRSLYRYEGSSTISPEAFKAYLSEILNSFADHGFKNVIVLNGHGGNNTALKEVAFQIHAERKANIAVVHWWELCADMTNEFFGHAGGHGGTDETAMVQAVDPTLADKGAYDPDLAWWFRPGADVYPVPGVVLLYREGEGHPNFNVEQARKYRDKVVGHVGDFCELVLTRWRKFGL